MSTLPNRAGLNSFNEQLIADLRAHGGNATSGPFLNRPVLILTTVGARTGRTRENPLVYTRSGEHHVVIASKGGAPSHPDWYHNLVANPELTVEVLGDTFPARARVAQGDEHDRLYSNQAAQMPAFAEYQANTSRKIPVVVLERI